MPRTRAPLFPLSVALFAVVLLSGCVREIPPEQKQADQILSKARDSFQRKLYHESQSLLWQSYALDGKLKRQPQMAEALELLAAIYSARADFDSAFAIRELAIEKYRSLADRPAARALLIENARLHSQLDDHPRSIAILTEALRLARLFKDEEGIRELQWALLRPLRYHHDVEEEREVLAELKDHYRSTNDLGMQAKVHLEEGLSALHHRDTQKAEEALLRALTFAEQARDSLSAIDALHHLARTYVQTGKTKEALDAYANALKRCDIVNGAGQRRVEILVRVGNAYLSTGAFGEAARFYRPALTTAINTGNKLLEGYLFIQLGHCDANSPGGAESATKNYRTALDLFEGVSYHRGAAYALISLGRFAQKRNQQAEALEHLTRAAAHDGSRIGTRLQGDLFDESEQSYSETAYATASEPAVELLLQLGRHDEAFTYIARRIESEAHKALNGFEYRLKDTAAAALLVEWRTSRARRIGAERQLDWLLSAGPREQDLFKDVLKMQARFSMAMDTAAAALLQSHPSLEPIVQPVMLDLAGVRALVPRDAALLVHVPTRKTLYVYLITPQRATVHVAAVECTMLEIMAEGLHANILQRLAVEDSSAEVKRKLQRALDESAAALYSVLIRPVESDISQLPRLLFIGRGALAGVPVHILRKSGASIHRPLALQALVSYLPSLSALALEPAGMKNERTVTGLGHQGTTEWDVEYELRDIRAFYKDARLLFGQQATLDALSGDDADVLHIAAEVRHNRLAPRRSAVVLSDGKSPGTTKAVSWGDLMTIPSFPVVLLSDLSAGGNRDLATLVHILLLNRTGVVSTNGWLPTRRTKKYVGEIFYTNLLSGATGSTAMRQVQLEMMKAEPYSGSSMWGAYFLWGK